MRALTVLGARDIEPVRVQETIGVLLKDSEDVQFFQEGDADRVYREYGMRVHQS